jgi:glycosyltransferase involved in cell wall biosynthesis
MNELTRQYSKDQLVSVIMPCYNAEPFLESSIKSVQAQTHTKFELIIVDDGSKDASVDISKQLSTSDKRIKYFCQGNKGAGPARNRGLSEARGQYIAFLDSDDYWDQTFIETMLKQLIETGADLAYCGWQNIGVPKAQGKPHIPPNYSSTNKLIHFLEICPWPIHAALTKRDIIENVGRFDESLSSCMDYDLWLKIGTRFNITRVPAVLSFYRHHGGEQITANASRGALNHYKVQCNYLNNNSDVIARLGRKQIRKVTLGELLRRGYLAYWKRDLKSARLIFRRVMENGYGNVNDWKYMLPSYLPLRLHQTLIKFFE